MEEDESEKNNLLLHHLMQDTEQVITRPKCVTDGDYIDYICACDAFNRFLIHIEKSTNFVKDQLSTLIYPVFVHLYLKILENRGANTAHEFFEKFQALLKKQENNEHIKELNSLETVEDVMEHEYFRNFWNDKYVLELSTAAADYLQTFFIEKESEAILDTLKFYFILHNFKYPKVAFHDESDEKESDDVISFSESKNFPLIISSAIINGHSGTNIFSTDINEDATKICAGIGKEYILAFERQINRTGVQYVLKKDENFLNDGAVHCVKFLSQSEKTFILKASKNKVSFLNTNNMKYESKSFVHNHQGFVSCMDVESTSSYFISGSEDGTTSLFDLKYHDPIRRFPTQEESINVVKFHPNGRYIAISSTNNSTELWSVKEALPVATLCHEAPVSSIDFSLDGTCIATADYRGKIKICDLNNHKVVATHNASWENRGDARILGLSFHPDRPILASCDYQGIRLWDYNLDEISETEKGKFSVYFEQKFNEKPLFLKFLKYGQLKVILHKNTDD